jgi:hypothetical protein
MLRKVDWAVLGITGLSLLLCAGGLAEAQSGEAGAQASGQVAPPAAPGAAGTGQGQAPAPAEAEDLRAAVAELRAEVARLQQEVARLRAEAGAGGSGAATGGGDTQAGPAAAQGTGGGGTAGTAEGTGGGGMAGTTAQGTGGGGTAGTAQGTGGGGAAGARSGQVVSDVPPAGSNVPSPQGTAVVDAIYTGVVRSASEQQVVIDLETGAPLVLGVEASTRVLREGRSIGVRQLERGERVRAVVDLVDQDQTLEIAVLPTAAPEG